jgi:nuclear pore complex protein Nup188
MQSLDDASEHGPLVLAWSVFRQVSSDPKGGVWARKLGNKALELHVFKYLSNMLQSEPFCGKTVGGIKFIYARFTIFNLQIVASTCHCVVYGLLCCVLSVYHEDTLGDSEVCYLYPRMLV